MTHQNFDHFILTRFNVPPSPGASKPSNQWLIDRLRIFKDWCLPSIRSQTVRPDYWLVFCDAESPPWFRQELHELLGPGEEAVWVSGSSSPEMFATAVANRCSGKPYLITTRVDNDDAISRDFVEMVQNLFGAQEKLFINFTQGSQHSQGRFYWRLDPSNAFISLIERHTPERTAPLTVFVDWHTRLGGHGDIARVKTHTAWIQNVHGGNIANVVRGLPVRPEKVLRHFSLSVPTTEVKTLKLLLDAILASVSISVRVATSGSRIKWLFKSIFSRR